MSHLNLANLSKIVDYVVDGSFCYVRTKLHESVFLREIFLPELAMEWLLQFLVAERL